MLAASTGGRRVTQALLRARDYRVEKERGVARKELARAAREAEGAFDLRPSARAVLKELVGCWGELELDGRLMVWPSNDYLIERTGLSERAVRLAVVSLVELKLIAPRDSANGKRFAIKNRQGEIVDAFGFDLAPLFERQAEFVALNMERRRRREEQDRLFDLITIARRAAEGALNAILNERSEIDAAPLTNALSALQKETPRRGSPGNPLPLLDRWQRLREKLEDLLKESGSAGTFCRHIETDNESSTADCNKGFPRSDVPDDLAQMCPNVIATGYSLRSAGDVLRAGQELRASLQAHKSVWEEGAQGLGPLGAALVVLLVYETYSDDVASGTGRILNPGGYLRAMMRTVQERRFDPIALLRDRKRLRP